MVSKSAFGAHNISQWVLCCRSPTLSLPHPARIDFTLEPFERILPKSASARSARLASVSPPPAAFWYHSRAFDVILGDAQTLLVKPSQVEQWNNGIGGLLVPFARTGVTTARWPSDGWLVEDERRRSAPAELFYEERTPKIPTRFSGFPSGVVSRL
jgi:hypothetical protein